MWNVLKLNIRALERRQWRVFFVKFKHISYFFYFYYCYLWTGKCLLGKLFMLRYIFYLSFILSNQLPVWQGLQLPVGVAFILGVEQCFGVKDTGE